MRKSPKSSFWVFFFLVVSLSHTPLLIALDRTQSPKDAAVYFITPQSGDTVSSSFTVRFGLRNMGVAPAGLIASKTGHHHLLINLERLPNLDEPLPSNANVRHFGAGQTEVILKLPRGTHTLQLLLGNHAHVPHQPPVTSKRITVTVQ